MDGQAAAASQFRACAWTQPRTGKELRWALPVCRGIGAVVLSSSYGRGHVDRWRPSNPPGPDMASTFARTRRSCRRVAK